MISTSPPANEARHAHSLGPSIAWRYVAGAANGLSAVSIAAVFGLALSVAVLIIVLSVVNGFERELRERVLGVLAHATIYFPQPARPDVRAERRLLGTEGITGVSPIVEEAALASNGVKVAGVLVTGIEPVRHQTVSDLGQYVRPSDAVLESGQFQAWFGARLARQLDVKVGDQVTLVLPIPTVSPVGLLPRQRLFTISGLINTQSEMDARGVFIHIDDARRLFRLGERIAGYQLRIADLFATDELFGATEAAFGEREMQVRPWTRVHGNLYQAIVTQKVTMFVLLSFLVAVAAFNLVSGLVMVAEQKRVDVAILRSLGSNTQTVLTIFLSLGLLLGGSGLCLGLLSGIGIAHLLPGLLNWASSWSGRELMGQYFISYLPIDVRSTDLIVITIISSILILLATLYPAWKATRQRPVEILAHE